MPDRFRWPLVVIGGGSAAAVQVLKGVTPPEDILVVSDRLGTGMAFLGEAVLQSYAHELAVSADTGEVGRLLPVGGMRPSAAVYDDYVRSRLLRAGCELLTGTVVDIRQVDGEFEVSLRGGDRVIAESVVLATGSAPRRPPAAWEAIGALSYADVYLRQRQGDCGSWRDRSVVVVGAGNSAMQTAALMAPAARDVVVLANRYVGSYPLETSDRFAWRAPSQLTCELVVKGGRECRSGVPIPCVRHLVYDTLTIEDGDVCLTYREERNRNPLGVWSMPPRCDHAVARPLGDGAWHERRRAAETTVVWATGSEPVYPRCALLDGLPRTASGAIPVDDEGRTPIPGLYAVGACAGRRAVNETFPAISTLVKSPQYG
ncbi:FAD-dependent oxidoreductase [Microbispora hainanensis]|uniref:FAD-dependent oxidoreductase n=1 Tax=Microbispora hainanensis TaxID=568844 RepID=UPI0033D1C633